MMSAYLFDLDGTSPIRARASRAPSPTRWSETVEIALAHYRERFADVGLFENTPYAGIDDALRTLAATGATLVVATSKPAVYARRIVEHFALGAHFAEVHGCELDGTREDKRDLIAHILPHHGFEAARAVGIREPGGVGRGRGAGALRERRRSSRPSRETGAARRTNLKTRGASKH